MSNKLTNPQFDFKNRNKIAILNTYFIVHRKNKYVSHITKTKNVAPFINTNLRLVICSRIYDQPNYLKYITHIFIFCNTIKKRTTTEKVHIYKKN